MATVTTSHSHLTPTASNSAISGSSSRACAKAVDATASDMFPAGLRVLVVDDDPICLLILDRMLRHCQYQVTTCGKATDALAMLRENRNSFDVILSDVYMPDMDGFKLLELVGLEMDLPVIMMSANGETSAVMKGIIHGACDYLLKPVRMEELRNIWQHVVRKKWRSSGQAASHEVDKSKHTVDEVEHTSSANEGQDGTWRQSKKRKDVKEEEDEVDLESDDPSSTKKPRVVWSVELHQQFVNAVNQLGLDKAVPKRILELMSAQGLTRENVASHLQKYRLYLKRLNGVGHQSAGGFNHPFPVAADANFGSANVAGLASLNELRNLAGPSTSALVSSLQSGALGRLNAANLGMANLDPSALLRLAALQGIGNQPFTRPPPLPSGGPPIMNVQGSFQVASNDLNQLHASQLGTFAGSLDKGLSGLPVFQSKQQQQQQQQLAAMARLGELGQIHGAGSNPPIASLNNNALRMQTLQQQSGQFTNTSKGGLPMPTNAGIGAQQALPADVDHWTAAALSGSHSGSLRMVSAPSLPNSATAPTPSGRATDVDSRGGAYILNAGNMAAATVSSPSISTGLDDLGRGGQTNDAGGSVLAANDGLRQSHSSKFGLFSGMKQEQEIFSGQRSQGPWQSLDIGQEQSHFHDRHIQSSGYSQSFSGGQGLMLGVGQDHSQVPAPRFSTGFSDNIMDIPRNIQIKALHAGSLRAFEGNLKIKEEGSPWFHEPLSDEVLTLLLKQQQEGLGPAENELGATDGYGLDNMYVK